MLDAGNQEIVRAADRMTQDDDKAPSPPLVCPFLFRRTICASSIRNPASSYKSLLHAQAVCVQWNAIVAKDPELSVQTFKRPSKVYVELACHEPSFRDEYGWYHADFKSQPIRLYPALDCEAYVLEFQPTET
ncbi:hypothetical protein DFH08DRAFT_1072097 [Mycena albidolilacea]|uniref:F-box domain-containing protein n=1 Tax=Mycena albidolilacea TaxID=1033008 RepID=A0AAD7ARJ2_9AGAR|nr:hypothetical protein DFH08DRAFT_1072097 [Mycena albidolilacea]